MTASRHAADEKVRHTSPEQPTSPAEANSGSSVIRETIDLLEVDLGAMIRAVEGAADEVCRGARLSADALGAIRTRTGALAAKSQDAKRHALQFAQATEELAQSSGEIGDRVRAADALTQEAAQATTAATGTIDGLR